MTDALYNRIEAIETFAADVSHELKNPLTSLRSAVEKRGGLPQKLGALLLQPTLAGLRRVVDYAEYGGAPLLGLDGVGVVAHGRSSPRAILNALRAAARTASGGLQAELTQRIGAAETWLPPRRERGRGATAEGVSE